MEELESVTNFLLRNGMQEQELWNLWMDLLLFTLRQLQSFNCDGLKRSQNFKKDRNKRDKRKPSQIGSDHYIFFQKPGWCKQNLLLDFILWNVFLKRIEEGESLLGQILSFHEFLFVFLIAKFSSPSSPTFCPSHSLIFSHSLGFSFLFFLLVWYFSPTFKKQNED